MGKHLDGFALDKSSRRIDVDGRLHVDRSCISKSAVNPYYGHEIPGYESLGLDPDKVYRLFRDPVELERGAHTFARLPILKKHIPVTVDSPQPDLIIGAIGSDVAFDEPYLMADLCFWDAEAIAGIDTDTVRELSCGYRYTPVMTAGVYKGSPYDGTMTEIKGNHLALVPVGRAGADVVVADRNPFSTCIEGINAMKTTKLGKALFVAICATSPVLAQDSATLALLGSADKTTFKKDETKAKLLAMDAAIDSNQLDSVIDAILDMSNDPAPTEPATIADDDEDETPGGKLRALLTGKVDDDTLNACLALVGTTADADTVEENDKRVGAAMDSFKLELRQADEARRTVRDVVGDVVAMDSASEIYAFALDHMKVAHAGITDPTALKALFTLANGTKASVKSEPRLATDAAAMVEQFPAASRFHNA